MLQLSFDGWTIWPCQPVSVWNCRLWRLESVAGLLSRRLVPAMDCLFRWRFRTFEMGILTMWMMENVRYLSEHLFRAELSLCGKCHGIYRRRERTRSREACQTSLLSLYSLRKHPFLFALRRWGCFARRNVSDSVTEIPNWWPKNLSGIRS